jgi:hypothetical protein
VTYGIDFDASNPSCITVYAPDENGNYGAAAGQACDSGSGTFVLTRTDPVVVDSINGGDLDTTLTFTPQ